MILTDNLCHADLHPGNVLVHFKKPIPQTLPWKATEYQEMDDKFYDQIKIASQSEKTSLLDTIHREGFQPFLTLLDAGLVSELSPPQYQSLVKIFDAAISFNAEKVADLIIAESKSPRLVLDPVGVRKTFQEMMSDVPLDDQGALKLSQISSAKIVQRFADLVRRHHIVLHGEYVGLYVSCVTVEGIGKSLNADLDVLDALAEFLPE
jgi:aarF domain-containing kinase